MAIDEALSARLRDRLAGLEGVSEKKMFGGLCFMVNGHMVAAASRRNGEGRYLFRIGKENADAAARLGQSEPMIHNGRRMSGFYFVDADDCSDADFAEWMSVAVENAFSLPPKP
ncbi:TfoX/Sxy family protein [Martelella endophytica]|uniref:RNA methyltransferase n=1 Tax=Martelella endophytica TaxID=1486262 RepID=A0A0D5LND5_MAREN|nr:TfoX/Sxy family protein [Martelella endophytica]AJY45646.1 RNA methyltransferase [Martelella endophytica]